MNKYKLYMILSIITLVLSIGFSFAYYGWVSSNNARVNFNVCTPKVTFVGGTTINGSNLIPVLNKENGVIKEVEVKVDKTCDNDVTMNLYMSLEIFGVGLSDSSFVYEIYNGTTLLKRGNFAGKSQGDVITLLTDEKVSTDKKVYTIYVYLDGNMDNPVTTQNQSFQFKLWASGEGAIYKENVITNINRPTSSKDSFFTSEVLREEIEELTIAEDNNVPEGVESVDISSNKDGSVMMWYEDADGNNLYEVYIGGENGVVETNTSGSGLFSYLTNIESLDLSNLDTSYMTSMSFMFYNSSGLKEINLSSFDTSNVTDMKQMFRGCTNLTSLDLSSFNTSSVTDVMQMFRGCTNLTSLDVSSFETSNVTNMAGMFYGCSSLTSLDLSNFNTAKVTSMGSMVSFGMFQDCSSLISLDLSSFDTSNVFQMSLMFSGCSSLVDLDVSSFDTSNVTDMNYMFSGCSSIAELDLSNFTPRTLNLADNLFYGCSSLRLLDIRNIDFSNAWPFSVFDGIPSDATIYVMDDWIKNWLNSEYNLTNVIVP